MKKKLSEVLSTPGLRRDAFLGFLFLAGFVLGALPWNWIVLPFRNPLEVVGPFTRIQFNPSNQIVRFLVLVLSPSFLLAGVWFWARPAGRDHYKRSSVGAPRWIENIGLGYLVLFPVLALAGYFGRVLESRPIDFLHHGEQMAPAWNSFIKGGFWSSSYFLHGVFFDLLQAKIGWWFWGVRSFGAYELVDGFLWAAVPSALCFFLFALSRLTAPESRNDRAVFVQVALFVFLFAGIKFHFSPHRYIPVYLGLGCFFLSLPRRRRGWVFISGLFSAVCFAYSIDVGAYYSATLLALCGLATVYEPRCRPAMGFWAALLAGVAVGWLGFRLAFGAHEFAAFLELTQSQFMAKDLWDGILLRSPLASGGGYSRLNMAVIAGVIFASVFEFLRPSPIQNRWLAFFFAGVSVVFFRSALGRSDVGHIQYAASFAYLGLGYWVWRRCGNFLASRARFAVPLLALLNLALIARAVGPVHWDRIHSFPARAEAYAHLPDASFLKGREKEFEALHSVFSQEPCLFSLTLDAALPFLLRKPTCNRFFIAWFASPKPLRMELLASLKSVQPQVVLVESPDGHQDADGIPNRERLPEIYSYLDAHYGAVEKVEGWGIRRKKLPVPGPSDSHLE